MATLLPVPRPDRSAKRTTWAYLDPWLNEHAGEPLQRSLRVTA